MRRRIKSTVRNIASALMLSAAVLAPLSATPAQAFFPFGNIVLDPSNLAQNLLTATRTLQQVNNQVRQLQNEAQMLINDSKHLIRTGYNPTTEINRLLLRINGLMQSAQSIQYTIAETDRVFRTQYPEDYSAWSNSEIATAAEAQRVNSRNAFHDALRVQSEIVQSIGADTTTLNRLLGETQSAQGELSFSQTGNQLMAFEAKQTMQMQQLMAAQYRAETLERARRLQIEQESRVRIARFVGGSSAYARR